MNSPFISVSRAFNANIDGPMRQHLTNVYATLTGATVLAAAGSLAHIYDYLTSGLLTTLLGLGCLIGLYSTPHEDKTVLRRLAFLSVFAFCSGLGMGPMIEYSLSLDPSIVVTALIGTAFVFSSFTLSALLSGRGSFLFMAGPLSTLLTTMLALSIGNLFFGSKLVFQANLYIGVLAMSLFVLYDTSLIMEKRRMGDKNFINHSVDLFIDLVGIFKRILIILSQKKEDEKERQRR